MEKLENMQTQPIDVDDEHEEPPPVNPEEMGEYEDELFPVLVSILVESAKVPRRVCKTLCDMMAAHDRMAPVDRHKGMANRRTIQERLTESKRKPVFGSSLPVKSRESLMSCSFLRILECASSNVH